MMQNINSVRCVWSKLLTGIMYDRHLCDVNSKHIEVSFIFQNKMYFVNLNTNVLQNTKKVDILNLC